MISTEQWIDLVYRDLKTNETIGCLYADNKNKIHAIMLPEEDLHSRNFFVPNIYLTLNAFKSKLSRKVNNISTFRAFYVDMDPYHLNLDLEETLLNVKRQFGRDCIPNRVNVNNLQVRKNKEKKDEHAKS